MERGMDDARAGATKLQIRLLNICMNYANWVRGAHKKHSGAI